MDIQCQCFLNIRDNSDISFTEIYKENYQKKRTSSAQPIPEENNKELESNENQGEQACSESEEE